jgi:hypothetical protein
VLHSKSKLESVYCQICCSSSGFINGLDLRTLVTGIPELGRVDCVGDNKSMSQRLLSSAIAIGQ